MSDAAMKVLEDARWLSAEDRQLVRDGLAADVAMAEVPPEVIDDELREVEARMADPQPLRPWDESMADILARLERRRNGQ